MPIRRLMHPTLLTIHLLLTRRNHHNILPTRCICRLYYNVVMHPSISYISGTPLFATLISGGECRTHPLWNNAMVRKSRHLVSYSVRCRTGIGRTPASQDLIRSVRKGASRPSRRWTGACVCLGGCGSGSDSARRSRRRRQRGQWELWGWWLHQ